VATIFNTVAQWMALVEAENFVVRIWRSHLESDVLILVATSIKIKSRPVKFAIPLIANTRFRDRTPVGAGTESCSLDFSLVLFDIFVQCQVLLNILKS